MPKTFGQRLKEVRRARRLSQKELAKRIGVDYSYISKLETGKAESPSLDITRKIAEVLGIDDRELLLLTGRVPEELVDVLQNVPGAAALLEMAGKAGLDEDALADISRRIAQGRGSAPNSAGQRTRDKSKVCGAAPALFRRTPRLRVACLSGLLAGAGVMLGIALPFAFRWLLPRSVRSHLPLVATTAVTLPRKEKITTPEELLTAIARGSILAPDLETLKTGGLRRLAGFHEGEVEVVGEADGKLTIIVPPTGKTARPEGFSLAEVTGFFLCIPEVSIRSKMLHLFAKGALEALQDPYAWFLDPASYTWMHQYEEGQHAGIGVRFEDGGTIHSVWQGTAGALAGLRPGDRVLQVDGVPVDRLTAGRVVRRTMGAPGSLVKLRVQREGQEFDVELTREPMRPLSVLVRDDEHVRWIRVRLFRSGTFEYFQAAMLKPPAACVLDLRGNGGGLISQAVLLADYFVGKPLEIEIADGAGTIIEKHKLSESVGYAGPLVVLVDAHTASSAEIVANALQVSGRATVVGQESEGKSYAQTALEVDGGGLICFTSGTWRIQGQRGSSVLPDILTVQGQEEAETTRLLAMSQGEEERR